MDRTEQEKLNYKEAKDEAAKKSKLKKAKIDAKDLLSKIEEFESIINEIKPSA